MISQPKNRIICFEVAYLHEIVKLCEHSKHECRQSNMTPTKHVKAHIKYELIYKMFNGNF